jgi:hypothetical protein
MSRKLTFKQLKVEKGWPYSRQYTHRLIREGKIPRPKKRPDGGAINLWDEAEIDAFFATFTTGESTEETVRDPNSAGNRSS